MEPKKRKEEPLVHSDQPHKKPTPAAAEAAGGSSREPAPSLQHPIVTSPPPADAAGGSSPETASSLPPPTVNSPPPTDAVDGSSTEPTPSLQHSTVSSPPLAAPHSSAPLLPSLSTRNMDPLPSSSTVEANQEPCSSHFPNPSDFTLTPLDAAEIDELHMRVQRMKAQMMTLEEFLSTRPSGAGGGSDDQDDEDDGNGGGEGDGNGGGEGDGNGGGDQGDDNGGVEGDGRT